MEKSRAIVAEQPFENGHVPGANWFMQDIQVPTELKDGEILVDMAATGVCHTDLIITSFPTIPGVAEYPRIPGHEGGGYVKAVGPNVKKDIKVGDPVLLSYDCCGKCHYCTRGKRTYCETFMPHNLFGAPGVVQSPEGKPIGAKCFGQSSFANLSIVNEASVLNARDLVKTKEELHLFAPLGCGLQTGAGAVLNLVKPGKDDRFMVLGLGGVGLAALFAAVISGCKQIIAVDRVDARLELAKSFGATHTFNTTGVKDLAQGLREIADGLGPTVCIDTTGVPPVIEAGFESIANQGTFVFVGATSDQDYELKVSARVHLTKGAKLIGCVLGDSITEDFVPELIKFYRAGKFPIDKITKFYPADDYQKALHDVHVGQTIKACLVW